MKSKKLITCVLTAVILTFSTSTVFALGEERIKDNKIQLEESVMPISAPIYEAVPINTQTREVRQAHFNSYSAIVKSMKDYEAVQGSKIIEVEDSQGRIANFIVTDDTYFVTSKEIKEGENVVAYYDANAAMIMIYPPQYKAEVIIVGGIEENVKVDLFDNNLISADGQLKIRVSENTEVLTQDGKKFEGSVANRNLVVTYNITTKSLPPQTNPTKIVVLDKEVYNSEDYTYEKIKDKRHPIVSDISIIRYIIQLIMRIYK